MAVANNPIGSRRPVLRASVVMLMSLGVLATAAASSKSGPCGQDCSRHKRRRQLQLPAAAWTLSYARPGYIAAFAGDHLTISCTGSAPVGFHSYLITLHWQGGQRARKIERGDAGRRSLTVSHLISPNQRNGTVLYVCNETTYFKIPNRKSLFTAELKSRSVSRRIETIQRPEMVIRVCPSRCVQRAENNSVLLVSLNASGSIDVECKVANGSGRSVEMFLNGKLIRGNRNESAAGGLVPCNRIVNRTSEMIVFRGCSIPVGVLECRVSYIAYTMSKVVSTMSRAALTLMRSYPIPAKSWSIPHGNDDGWKYVLVEDDGKSVMVEGGGNYVVMEGGSLQLSVSGKGNEVVEIEHGEEVLAFAEYGDSTVHSVANASETDAGQYTLSWLTNSGTHDLNVVNVEVVRRPEMTVSFAASPLVYWDNVTRIQSYLVAPGQIKSAVLACYADRGETVTLWRGNVQLKTSYSTSKDIRRTCSHSPKDCVRASAVVWAPGFDRDSSDNVFRCMAMGNTATGTSAIGRNVTVEAAIRILQLYNQSLSAVLDPTALTNRSVIVAAVNITGYPLPIVRVTLPGQVLEDNQTTYHLLPGGHPRLVRVDNGTDIQLHYRTDELAYRASLLVTVVSRMSRLNGIQRFAGDYEFEIVDRILLGAGVDRVVVMRQAEDFDTFEDVVVVLTYVSGTEARCSLNQSIGRPLAWEWSSEDDTGTATEFSNAAVPDDNNMTSILHLHPLQANDLHDRRATITCRAKWTEWNGVPQTSAETWPALASVPVSSLDEARSTSPKAKWKNITLATGVGLGLGIPALLLIAYMGWRYIRAPIPHAPGSKTFTVDYTKEIGHGSSCVAYLAMITNTAKDMAEGWVVVLRPHEQPQRPADDGPRMNFPNQLPTSDEGDRPLPLAQAESMETLRRHWTILSQLQENDQGHSNVITMLTKYDSLMRKGDVFTGRIILEYAPNGTLLEFLKAKVPRRKRLRCNYIDCMCHTMAATRGRARYQPRHLSTTPSPLPPPSTTEASCRSSRADLTSAGSVDSLDVGEQRDHLRPAVFHDIVNQILEAMKFIRKRGVTHGDLAARNILIGNKGVLKVSDFGHSHSLLTVGMPRTMPAHHAAPECLAKPGTMCPESDIWSFGVLLWEVCTLGLQPYKGKEPKDIFAFITEGGRLAQPRFCRDDVYTGIMCSCWDIDPSNRPRCEEIQERLDRIPHSDNGYIPVLPESDLPPVARGYLDVVDAVSLVTMDESADEGEELDYLVCKLRHELDAEGNGSDAEVVSKADVCDTPDHACRREIFVQATCDMLSKGDAIASGRGSAVHYRSTPTVVVTAHNNNNNNNNNDDDNDNDEEVEATSVGQTSDTGCCSSGGETSSNSEAAV